KVSPRDGILWFDVGPNGITVSTVSEEVRVTHRIDTAVQTSALTGFGIPAHQIGSIAQGSLNQERPYGLEFEITRRAGAGAPAGAATVRPDRTTLTNGTPIEACLIGVPGMGLDEDDPGETARYFGENLTHYALDVYFERPLEVEPSGPGQMVGDLDHVALAECIRDAKRLLRIGARSGPQTLELRDACLLGGGQGLAVWYDVPSLVGLSLRLAVRQVPSLLALLRCLPSGAVRMERASSFLLLRNGWTTIAVREAEERHPLDPSALRAGRPQAAVSVGTARFRGELAELWRGRGAECAYQFLRAELVAGAPHSLKLEGRRPADGQQTVRLRPFDCKASPTTAPFDILTHLGCLEQALPRDGRVEIGAGDRHLYLSSQMVGRRGIRRTVRIGMVRVERPDRIERQVREIGYACDNQRGETPVKVARPKQATKTRASRSIGTGR
ncbi:hypothetical protein, partial [Paracraurococcus lichenis]